MSDASVNPDAENGELGANALAGFGALHAGHAARHDDIGEQRIDCGIRVDRLRGRGTLGPLKRAITRGRISFGMPAPAIRA